MYWIMLWNRLIHKIGFHSLRTGRMRCPLHFATISTSTPASAKRQPANSSWENEASAAISNSSYPFLIQGAALPHSAAQSIAGMYN